MYFVYDDWSERKDFTRIYREEVNDLPPFSISDDVLFEKGVQYICWNEYHNNAWYQKTYPLPPCETCRQLLRTTPFMRDKLLW